MPYVSESKHPKKTFLTLLRRRGIVGGRCIGTLYPTTYRWNKKVADQQKKAFSSQGKPKFGAKRGSKGGLSGPMLEIGEGIQPWIEDGLDGVAKVARAAELRLVAADEDVTGEADTAFEEDTGEGVRLSMDECAWADSFLTKDDFWSAVVPGREATDSDAAGSVGGLATAVGL